MDEQKTKPALFPKCPYNRTELVVMRLTLVALSIVGLYYLNLWVAVVFLIYSIGFYFFAYPLRHCRYCFYQLKNITKDEWKEAYLQKHVDCGKKWGFNFSVLWFTPIILIGISLFLSFSTVALLSLIGFIAVLAVMGFHFRRNVCTTCAIQEECWSSF